MTLLALWESRGQRWRAELHETGEDTVELREFKNDQPIGLSFQTFEGILALGWRSVEAWAAQQVAHGFDVQMYRKAI